MQRPLYSLALLSLLPVPALAQEQLPPEDEAAAFQAAGFTQVVEQWRNCLDAGAASYVPGAVETVRDINGDKRPDAILTEGGAGCYGMTGQSFWLVSKQPDGSWRLMASEVGIPRFLRRSGTDGWPDLEIGGPGSCFPVQRWTGSSYVTYRYHYQGKACRPDG